MFPHEMVAQQRHVYDRSDILWLPLGSEQQTVSVSYMTNNTANTWQLPTPRHIHTYILTCN